MFKPIAALAALAVLATPAASFAAPVSLPSDPLERAATCAAAILGQQPENTPFAVADRAAHLLLLASGGTPEGMSKAQPILISAAQKLAGNLADVDPTVAACDKAFPRTVANAPLRMPKDANERVIGCAILGSYMQGFYQGFADGKYPEAARYGQLVTATNSKIEGALVASNITTEEQVKAKIYGVAASLSDYGPPTKVADACLKEFG